LKSINKEKLVVNKQSWRSPVNRIIASVCLSVAALLICAGAGFAQSKTIIDEWASVQAPKAPELKSAKIDDPKSTAFLVLDLIKQSCNNQRRPRCVASVAPIQAFLTQVRSKGLPVIHSYTTSSAPGDFLPEVAPAANEPLVRASADKFVGTDLEKILRDKGIKTVIVVGTAAHGAVISTATQAAFRGFKVIVPVDGMSSESLYFEQYTAYHLTTAPGVAQQTTLTKFDMIQF
jgi:nicotinamidase-related amidase